MWVALLSLAGDLPGAEHGEVRTVTSGAGPSQQSSKGTSVTVSSSQMGRLFAMTSLRLCPLMVSQPQAARQGRSAGQP